MLYIWIGITFIFVLYFAQVFGLLMHVHNTPQLENIRYLVYFVPLLSLYSFFIVLFNGKGLHHAYIYLFKVRNKPLIVGAILSKVLYISQEQPQVLSNPVRSRVYKTANKVASVVSAQAY